MCIAVRIWLRYVTFAQKLPSGGVTTLVTLPDQSITEISVQHVAHHAILTNPLFAEHRAAWHDLDLEAFESGP